MSRFKSILLAVGIPVLVIILVFLIAVYGFGFLQRETADFRGETEQIEQTEADSDFRK